MKRLKQLSLALIAGTLTFGVGASGVNNPSAQAIQFSNGRSSFGVPFQLSNTRTSQASVRFRGASYYFTFNLPKTASQSLNRVTIRQNGGNLVEFDSAKTKAFLNEKPKENCKLGEVKVDKKTQEVDLVFDPPIQPGQTVTVAIGPFENPSVSGIYNFGVSAFPTGDKPEKQFLGYGPLRFFDAR
ncbi:DUF2808 domain-containing protein [Coleofasciculus sp. FACHB-SPT36]|uniref:DUF2808 domain-containing protein n=1 Tax=Cyanophyceae TaxID=3028117 RepID=UPI00168AAD32|nr:DUF2808 domain-containing protein [Coleofasciculus sp. FACHB-SPT36]MBD2539225.1 DUF2808 domain-containing protein [Coleofasciculus sp. FACHB-SPT36]